MLDKFLKGIQEKKLLSVAFIAKDDGVVKSKKMCSF